MRIVINFFVISLLLPLYLHSSTFNIKKIQKDFNSKIKHSTKFKIDANYWKRAQKHLWAKRRDFSRSQFIILVDLSKQVLIVVLWDKKIKTFYPIGFDFISSGNIQREVEVTNGDDHYMKTPTGLFSIQSGWRSKGEVYDDNVTMPYGKKGRYVFYFGKQKSVRYNTFDKNTTKIKDKKKWQLITDELEFAIHAHKSTAPLGVPQSHGCIRMSNELNLYLENNLVFFKHLIDKNKKWLHPYYRPPKEPKNHDLAGKYMLVVDKI